jgi:hypothetical protein
MSRTCGSARNYLWSRQLELTLGSAASHLAALGERIAR